jgi:hypothetical protein
MWDLKSKKIVTLLTFEKALSYWRLAIGSIPSPSGGKYSTDCVYLFQFAIKRRDSTY